MLRTVREIRRIRDIPAETTPDRSEVEFSELREYCGQVHRQRFGQLRDCDAPGRSRLVVVEEDEILGRGPDHGAQGGRSQSRYEKPIAGWVEGRLERESTHASRCSSSP
jgi:hypothetical protein